MTNLDNWLKRSPYGKWIPENWRDTEPTVNIFITCADYADDGDSILFGLVKDDFFPDLPNQADEAEYRVPQFVADLLVWYCDGYDESGYMVEVVP